MRVLVLTKLEFLLAEACGQNRGFLYQFCDFHVFYHSRLYGERSAQKLKEKAGCNRARAPHILAQLCACLRSWRSLFLLFTPMAVDFHRSDDFAFNPDR